MLSYKVLMRPTSRHLWCVYVFSTQRQAQFYADAIIKLGMDVRSDW